MKKLLLKIRNLFCADLLAKINDLEGDVAKLENDLVKAYGDIVESVRLLQRP